MTGLNTSLADERPALALQLELERLRAGELARVALLAGWMLARRALRTGLRWHQRSRQRTALGNLTDHLLRDIGLERTVAQAEYRKWFWQP